MYAYIVTYIVYFNSFKREKDHIHSRTALDKTLECSLFSSLLVDKAIPDSSLFFLIKSFDSLEVSLEGILT
jgi:hypothetical protein